jgi:hypothetical protein
MITGCKEIDKAINVCRHHGLPVKEITSGWSEARTVVEISGRLTQQVKDDILAAVPELEYWTYKGSPHNSPDEGFICRRCSVVISFCK